MTRTRFGRVGVDRYIAYGRAGEVVGRQIYLTFGGEIVQDSFQMTQSSKIIHILTHFYLFFVIVLNVNLEIDSK